MRNFHLSRLRKNADENSILAKITGREVFYRPMNSKPGLLKPRKTYWVFLLIFLLLSSAITLGGFYYFENQKGILKEQQWNQLKAIADLKLRQIVNWRQERLRDGTAISETPVSSPVERWLRNPRENGGQRAILAWMAALQRIYKLHDVFLLDGTGNVRLSLASASHLSPETRNLAGQALRQRKVILSDLDRAAGQSGIHLDLLVPLLLPGENKALPVGLLVIRLDPSEFLFPLLQTWPLPSHSSETLLVRREGEEIIILNDLRGRSGAALNLRFPIGKTRLPAAMAARGQEGRVEGVDYRGVPVLAAIMTVPDSPWFLIAKVDQKEIYDPIYRQAIMVGIVAVLLILGAGLGVGLLWRGQSARFQRALAGQAEQQARMQDEILSASPDLIFLYNREGRITYANRASHQAMGRRPGELIGRTWRELGLPEETIELAEKQREAVFSSGRPLRGETAFPTPEGERHFEYVISPIRGVEGAAELVVANAWDITDRKQAEGELQRHRDHLEELVQARTGALRASNEQLQSEVEYRRQAESALRASEERYRTIVETSQEGIWILDGEDRTRYANRRLAEMLGQTVPKMLGRSLFEFMDGEGEKAAREYLERRRRGISEVHEFRFRRRDGSFIWTLVSVNPLRDSEGRYAGALSMVTDITIQKNAEERLRYLSTQLLKSQEEEQVRMAKEIHDSLGTQLAAIKFSLQRKISQLGSGLSPETIRLEEIISLVQNGIEEIRRILGNLRPLMLDDLGILPTLNWFFREFQKVYSGIGVEKEIEIQEEEIPEPLKIVIFRILQEATSNIAKHSRADQVRVSLAKGDGAVHLAIRNNGQGFHLEEILAQRRGLGLVSMRERAELSGGSFAIESAPGDGTSIRASWPV